MKNLYKYETGYSTEYFKFCDRLTPFAMSVYQIGKFNYLILYIFDQTNINSLKRLFYIYYCCSSLSLIIRNVYVGRYIFQ